MDDTELDIESLRTPQLHNKYLNMYHDERLLLTKKEEELKSLLRKKWEYYTARWTLKLWSLLVGSRSN